MHIPRPRRPLLVLFVLLCWTLLIFFYPVMEDVADSQPYARLTGTDTALSVRLLPEDDKTLPASLPVYSWQDIILHTAFREALPEIYPEAARRAAVPSLFYLQKINVSRSSSFENNSLYFSWQFPGAQFDNPEAIFQRALDRLVSLLAEKDIHVRPSGKIIHRDTDLRVYSFFLILIKSILIMLTGLALIFSSEAILRDRGIARWLPALLLGITILLLFMEEAVLVLVLGLLLGSLLFSGYAYFQRRESGRLRAFLKAAVLLSLFSILFLFLIRLEYYIKPQFVREFEGDILFYQKIELQEKHHPRKTESGFNNPTTNRMADSNNDSFQSIPYAWIRLPETSLFRRTQLKQENATLSSNQIREAMENYPFPCRILEGQGQGLQDGQLYFTLTFRKAAFSKADDPEAQLRELRERGMIRYTYRMLDYFLDLYKRFLLTSNLHLKRLGNPGMLPVYPEEPPYPTRERAIAAAVFFLILGWLLFSHFVRPQDRGSTRPGDKTTDSD